MQEREIQEIPTAGPFVFGLMVSICILFFGGLGGTAMLLSMFSFGWSEPVMLADYMSNGLYAIQLTYYPATACLIMGAVVSVRLWIKRA